VRLQHRPDLTDIARLTKCDNFTESGDLRAVSSHSWAGGDHPVLFDITAALWAAVYDRGRLDERLNSIRRPRLASLSTSENLAQFSATRSLAHGSPGSATGRVLVRRD
jgi:hypothetical protein